ncbi:hypothetical protein IN07_03760 [Modestobacter caceresii]|uniref:Uncharacterized protein n=1 Tax=Modestobacter caceresii TaxID=1522368 RepID=A0A098YBH1_9ACTN|nr:hypothetical protein [Modestobacter caceresii]KGH48178.1 hypothetical protein IN07_03760 [Modestobacter caceresii]
MHLSEALASGTEGVLSSGGDDVVVVVPHEGWRVGFRLAARGRRAVEVSFLPPDPLPGLDQLRTLPLGRLLTQARRLAAAPPPSPFTSITELNLSGWKNEGRGPQGRPLRDWAWLAWEYVARKEAGEANPAREISERFGHGSPKVWSNRIARARELGMWEDDHGTPCITGRADRLLGSAANDPTDDELREMERRSSPRLPPGFRVKPQGSG